MPLDPQRRALAIIGGVFGSGLLIAFLAVTVFGGDDSKQTIDIEPKQPSTSTSSLPPTTIPSTLPPTTIAVPPTVTQTTGGPPPTIVVVPPATAAPTTPTTPTTAAPTPTTTSPPTVAEELETILAATLLGDAEPPPFGTPPRVRVAYDADDFVRVSWDLDDTLSETEQRYTVREEAVAILRAVQSYSRIGDERIILRAFLPDPDDPGETIRVVRLEFDRATLDAIDFDTLDPLTIFELADDADIDPALEPAPPPTTSTSSSTTTTTTT